MAIEREKRRLKPLVFFARSPKAKVRGARFFRLPRNTAFYELYQDLSLFRWARYLEHAPALVEHGFDIRSVAGNHIPLTSKEIASRTHAFETFDASACEQPN